MIIFFVILLILCLYNIQIRTGGGRNQFYEDSLDKSSDQSTCIKGIFAFIIILQHVRNYFRLDGSISSTSFSFILNNLSQLMVVMFLFYSGYGIITSYRKNKDYFKTFPRTRILKTLVHYDLAVLIYLVVDLLMNIHYPTKQILLAFVGWESVGNLCWFIFAMLVAYVVIFLLHLFIKNPKLLSFLTFIPLLAYIFIISKYKTAWWYNTILCIPFGMVYACYKEKIENFVLKTRKRYFLYLLSLFILFGIAWYVIKKGFDPYQLTYNVMSMIFALIVVTITYNVRIVNPALKFLGVHSFSIYILQILPMMTLKSSALVNYPVLFTGVCITLTLIISYFYTKFCNLIDKYLFSKNVRKNKQINNNNDKTANADGVENKA